MSELSPQTTSTAPGPAAMGHSGGFLGQKWASAVVQRRRGRGDEGAVLILALVYILVISVTVGALAYWATNDINNTGAFFSGTQLQFAASSATKTAVQSIRSTPEPYTPSVPASQLTSDSTLINGTSGPSGGSFVPSNSSGNVGVCWAPPNGTLDSTVTVNGIQVTVWCTTGENLVASTGLSGTRVVTVYACLSTYLESQCVPSTPQQSPPGLLLTAVFSFDDYPPAGGAPLTNQCNLISANFTCGQGATEVSWVYNKSDGS